MIVVPGPSSQKLGYKIAELLKQKIIPIEFKRFPDGESYIRFEGEVGNKDVV
ncbi:ribose-phosphate pyrophosphokinase-like domain-containing protein, partial [Candidatus Bathyarchaeota archaeon]|nr:ribose-phosphate pyrophosphokinase-like domain-containing protein [Candidatus Bathyarchaeota archaeon]